MPTCVAAFDVVTDKSGPLIHFVLKASRRGGVPEVEEFLDRLEPVKVGSILADST